MKSETLHISKSRIMNWLREVRDPEIPVLNIVEMGIVRKIQVNNNGVRVLITPTYSGCPAMSAIEDNIKQKLRNRGIPQLTVKKDFSSSWTTDWMTEEACNKLKDYGIAPPKHLAGKNANIPLDEKTIACPFCDSTDTSLQSEFGSTSCKALFYCDNCNQAFEHFKCH